MRKFTLLFLLLTLLFPVTSTAQQDENTYTDPQGLFSVPIPTGWTVEESDDYALLTSPDEKIEVYLLTAEGDDTQAAIQAAWEQIVPGFDLEAADVQSFTDPAITEGAEEIMVVTYDNPDDEQTVFQGVGIRHEGRIYLILFNADLIAAQQRSAQIQVINSGYEIAAIEQTDLTGVEPLPLSDELLAELESYIVEKMEQLEVTGASVAIVQGNEIVYAKGFGVRGGEFTDPVTPETLMMIGSTTKTMTTMLMGILVDEGKMAWDTPVVEILPNFALADPERTSQLTVKHLVCACTGVPRQDLELIFNYNNLTAEDVIESLAGFELYTDFGEAFQYSNQMVAVGGYVAAVAAGGEYGNLYDTYVNLMEERIFEPIGMESTTFSFEEVQASGNYAIPYVQNVTGDYEAAALAVEEWLNIIAPAGAVWSNANDMANYLITEIQEGVAPNGIQVISAENLAYTWQPQVQVTAETSYGLGWLVDEYKGLPVLHHGGNTLGFTSDMAFLPDAGLGIVVLSNQRASIFNEAVRFRLLELVFEQDFEFDAQINVILQMIDESVTEFEGQLLESLPENLETFTGMYTNEKLGEMTLELRDGKLYADAGEFVTEVRAAENEDGELYYVFYDAPLGGLTFQLDGDALILGEGVLEYTFTKVE